MQKGDKVGDGMLVVVVLGVETGEHEATKTPSFPLLRHYPLAPP